MIVPPVLGSDAGRALVPISEKKREPVSDIDTAVVDSLKVLDPKRPIREERTSASILCCSSEAGFSPYQSVRLNRYDTVS